MKQQQDPLEIIHIPSNTCRSVSRGGGRGWGRHLVLQLLGLCPHGKAGSEELRWENVSNRERIWFKASLGTQQLLCLSSLQLPVCVLPKKQPSWCPKTAKSSTRDVGRLQQLLQLLPVLCLPRNSQVAFPKKQKAVLGMLGHCNRYLENLKFKLGVGSSRSYLKADGYLLGPSLTHLNPAASCCMAW